MNQREIAEANLILIDLEREVCVECKGERRVDDQPCDACDGEGTVFIRDGDER